MRAPRISHTGAFRIRDMHYGPRDAQGRHTHAEGQISIVVAGVIDEVVGGVAYRGRAGDVVIKPADITHSDDFDHTRIVCIDAPPDALPDWLSTYEWHRLDSASSMAMRVASRFLAGSAVDEDLHDLLAAIRGRELHDRVVSRRAAEALSDSIARQLSIADLARELGVHRVYLARVFREQWGCSPREYVLRLRVREAAHRIASTREPLAEIALDAGFSDQAHMTRVFSRVMCVTPAAFRRLTA